MKELAGYMFWLNFEEPHARDELAERGRAYELGTLSNTWFLGPTRIRERRHHHVLPGCE